MKKSSLKSLTFALALSMATILLALPSCKSLDPTFVTSAISTASATTHSHDTVILRDTLYRQDSVIYRERTIHDTVYITKEVYRDRHHSTLNAKRSTIADTIHVVEYRDRVVEHPPERYIPPFYKRCTVIFWILIVGIVLYVIQRIRFPTFNL